MNSEKATEIALKLLHRRYSRRKLYLKLREKGFSAEICEETVSKMEKLGYIDDKDYAEAFVHDCIFLQKYGPRKIKDGLFRRGISSQHCGEALSRYDDEIHLENIRTFLLKFTDDDTLSPYDAAKFFRRMESRGFYRKQIEEVLSEITIIDESEV